MGRDHIACYVVLFAYLDDGPIGVRVGEGHAELDDIGAAGVQEPQRLRRCGQVGVAGGDVRDERRLRSRTAHRPEAH